MTATQTAPAPVLAYIPLTGPVPEGLTPGKTFDHREVEITAELAAMFLAVNAPNQRAISWIAVERMVAEMLQEEWDDYHPEPMIFSSEGYLIDGQHRCTALIEAEKVRPGMRLVLNVEHNWDPKVWDKLNQGKKRAPSDVLDKSMKHRGYIAAAAKLFHDYSAKDQDPPITYMQWRKNSVSPAAIKAWVEQNPDISTSLDLAVPLWSKAYMNKNAATVGIFLLRQQAQVDRVGLKVVHEFINGIADPVAAGCSVLDPRNALNANFRRKKVGNTNVPRPEWLGLFLRAWEKWCAGEETSDIQWKHGRSKMPDVFVPPDWKEVPRKWGIKL